MTLSTLLVHVDDSPHAETRIEAAARLAAEHGARLVGLASASVARLSTDVARYLPAAEIDRMARAARDGAEACLARFETIARRHELAGVERRLADQSTVDAIVQAARYADLVVVSQGQDQTIGDTPFEQPADIVEQAGRPVLILSRAWRNQPLGRRIAAAWDGSREAVRALTDALPLLRRAEQVDLLVFNSRARPVAHGEEPGADIGLWLTRHGVRVQVIRDTVDIDIGSALLSRIADLGSDLVVMGGFGHSRLRESLFGGVTRTMLESMTVPVVMSH